MVFKLPRLPANLSISNGTGLPTTGLTRLWDLLCRTIEFQEQGQDDLLAALIAAQEAAEAAQLAAETAQANAETAQIAAEAAQATATEALGKAEQGARYTEFSGTYPTVNGSLNNQSANAILAFSITAENGTISADTEWVGTFTFYEATGGAPVLLGSVEVTLPSNGLTVGGAWRTDPTTWQFQATGTLAGTVTYTVTGAYSSGATLVANPDLNVTLTTTPRAT